MEIIVLIAAFISFSILIESLGVWMRLIGAHRKEAATGYSTHVRLATLGRFFILISAPLLGYQVDNDVSPRIISLIGFIAFSLVFSYLLADFFLAEKKYLIYIYNFLNKRSSNSCSFDLSGSRGAINWFFVLFSFFAFLLTASGVVVVNYIASSFPDNRGMIVQMSAFVTMLGTLAHVFLLDPRLAAVCDNDTNLAKDVVRDYLMGRMIASIVLSSLFGQFYLWS